MKNLLEKNLEERVSRQKKLRRSFGKNAGEWTGRVKITKKALAVGVACMAVYRPAFGLKGRTFELWVLNRWALISASAVPHYGVPKQQG